VEQDDERWKPLPACYPAGYEVSDRGRIRSFRSRDGLPRVLRMRTHKWGYVVINLGSDDERKVYRVHRLVLEAFVGPCPEGQECRHLDGDKTNNRLDNLRWDTHGENILDRFRHGTVKFGEDVPNAKLRRTDIPQILELRASGRSFRDIGGRFGVGEATIEDVVYGRTWKQLPESRGVM
jgi:hypothetical protein